MLSRQVVVTATVLILIAGCQQADRPRKETPVPRTIVPGDLTVVTGEYWYAMRDENGNPQGYCHYTVKRGENGGTAIAWELRLAFPGGTYQEDRTLDLDRHMTMQAASYTDGQARCEGRRNGSTMVGAMTNPDRSPATTQFSVTAPAGALSGMDFVMAAWMPLEVGATMTTVAMNEADGFAVLGPTRFEVVGRETVPVGGPVRTLWRINRVFQGREKTTTLPLWVDDAGRILKTDWGGGNMMVYSEKPTKDLFKPEK